MCYYMIRFCYMYRLRAHLFIAGSFYMVDKTLKGPIPSILVFIFTTSLKSLSPKINLIMKPKGLHVVLGLISHFIYVLCNSSITSQRAI